MDVERFRDSPVGHVVRLAGIDGRTQRSYDHWAYVADQLAAEPSLQGATWRVVARAGHALGRLQQAGRQVPQPALLRRPTLRREAQSTSALEGTYAPLEDVLEAEASADDRSAELSEVLNYVDAAELGFAWVADGRPLTVGLLAELHATLVAGTTADTEDSGRLRRIPVAIGGRGDGLETSRFVPMPPGPALTAAVTDLVDWVERPPGDRDPVVAAAMAHYQFETLHPFNDGNGRLGRLLVVLQLLRQGVIDEPLLSVSPWFEQRRPKYQEHLAEVSATGDWDAWVSFFATGLEASATDTAQRVHDLLAVEQEYLHRVADAGLSGAVETIVRGLIAAPYVRVARLSEAIGRTYQATNTAVARLVELDVLRETPRGGRGRVFVATAVVEVLLRR
ncbi:Fic family protein [Pseudokineococcus sp. 1T1Z-3]|uniref:Fic family protein n=1 Tax=Pseudokineococcus sp. 1T1Z-3 TaxID=3132745 RepID=UPI0030A2506C